MSSRAKCSGLPWRASPSSRSYGPGWSPKLLLEQKLQVDLPQRLGAGLLRLEQEAAPPSGSIRITISSDFGVALSAIPIGGGLLKITRSSVTFASMHLPARMKKGTPAQRQLSTNSRRAKKVSVVESGATPSTSR